MRPALARIEDLLKTQRSPAVRGPMLAIYLLWHRLLPVDTHRPSPHQILNLAVAELGSPSIYSFTVAVLLDVVPPWSVDEFCELAEQRHAALQGARPLELPDRVDASLWICTAQLLWVEGLHDLARAAVSMAVECSPGDADLLALEHKAEKQEGIVFDVRKFLLGLSSDTPQP